MWSNFGKKLLTKKPSSSTTTKYCPQSGTIINQRENHHRGSKDPEDAKGVERVVTEPEPDRSELEKEMGDLKMKIVKLQEELEYGGDAYPCPYSSSEEEDLRNFEEYFSRAKRAQDRYEWKLVVEDAMKEREEKLEDLKEKLEENSNLWKKL